MKAMLIMLVLTGLFGFFAYSQMQDICKHIAQPCHTNLHGVNPVGIVGLK